RNSPPKLEGVARRRFISRDGVVPKPRTTPSARNKVASRLFIDRAATPPNLGGEFLFGCFTTFGIILKFEWFHVCWRSFRGIYCHRRSQSQPGLLESLTTTDAQAENGPDARLYRAADRNPAGVCPKLSRLLLACGDGRLV